MPENVERVKVIKSSVSEIRWGNATYLFHEHPIEDSLCLLGESLGALPDEISERLFGARGAFTVYGVKRISDFDSLNTGKFRALLAEKGFAGRKVKHYPPKKWRKQIQEKLFPSP